MAGPTPNHSLPQKPRKSGRVSRMQRADSGFVESPSRRPSSDTGRSSLTNGDWRPPSADQLAQRLHEEASKTPAMKDSPHSSPRRKSEGRRPSAVSSINSTKPRRSRPSSHKSSRRTPVIHQSARPKLRGSQTMPPLPTRDVDDVLALHHRSCSLFRSISTTAPPESYAAASGMTHADSRFPATGLGSPSAVSLSLSANETDDVAYPHVYVPPTTIHWTSPGTRRREYEEIDRSCRGLRGLLSKVKPRWGASSKPTRFYDADASSDVGSVRRYRLDLPEDDEDEEEFEKRDQESGSTVSLRSKSKSKPTRLGMVERWRCF